nr:unnamed protein product [Digitaria exilis]
MMLSALLLSLAAVHCKPSPSQSPFRADLVNVHDTSEQVTLGSNLHLHGMTGHSGEVRPWPSCAHARRRRKEKINRSRRR